MWVGGCFWRAGPARRCGHPVQESPWGCGLWAELVGVLSAARWTGRTLSVSAGALSSSSFIEDLDSTSQGQPPSSYEVTLRASGTV